MRCKGIYISQTLQWCHNERNGVSNHRRLHCLLNFLFSRRSKKTSKLSVIGLCMGNSPVTGEFPAQKASNAENVSIWWRHHELDQSSRDSTATDFPSQSNWFTLQWWLSIAWTKFIWDNDWFRRDLPDLRVIHQLSHWPLTRPRPQGLQHRQIHSPEVHILELREFLIWVPGAPFTNKD